MNPRVAIVGAGISGLAAGVHLIKVGFTPVIFEQNSFVGGRMSSEIVDGFIIDKAAYTFPEFYRNLKQFVGLIGMEASLVQTTNTSSTFFNGQGYPLKIGAPSDFLSYKLLSIKNKKDMVKLFLYARSLGKALNLDRPTSKTFELEHQTVTDYLRAHYNEQILERIAYPIFCEIFLGTPETNSKIALCVLLKNLMKFKIFALADGMGSLPGHLSKDLDIRLNSPVTKIIPLGEKGPCEVEVGGVSPMSLEFDAVIMAIPLPRVPELVEKLPDELTQYFDTIVYAPSIVVALALEDQVQNTSMINNLLRSEFDILGTVVFDHHKSPRRVPSGKAMATAILREQASRKLFDQSDEKITDQVLNEMDNLFAKFSSKLMFFRIYRWEYGALQLPPGQLTKRKSVHHILDEGVNHIYFAGESFPISSLEASFNSGLNAANQIIMKMKNEELE